MHLFNNIELMYAMTSIITILSGLHEKVCIIKQRLNWLFFITKIIDKGLQLFENVTNGRFLRCSVLIASLV